MKRLGKSVSVIIAVLILIFSVVSVFGISYYTGDNRNTIIKGFGDLDWGTDVSNSTKFVLEPIVSATADEAEILSELHDTAQVIENRAVRFGLTDYKVFVNDKEQQLTLCISEGVDSDLSAQEVATILVQYGNLTIRSGDEHEDMMVDSAGGAAYIIPSGETAETVLLEGEHVTDASWVLYTEEGVSYYYINLTFDEVGSTVMSSITNADTGQYYNQTMSVWLDDRMLAAPTVNQPITDGAISFSDIALTESKAELFCAVINEGVLPMELSLVSYGEAAPMLGTDITNIIMIVGIIALVAIAVVMIVRYRLVGVVSVFAMLAQFSLVLALVTRFCFGDSTFQLTISGASALALSVLLSVFCCVLVGEKLRSELNSSTVVGTAVTNAIEASKKTIMDINIILAIVAFVGMFLFGSWNLTFAIFGGSAVSGVYNFSYVLFFGAVFNFVSGYFLPQLMLRSLTSFDAFNKPSMFGGAK